MPDFLICACQLCAHSAVHAPSPTLLRHRCTLLSASQITVSILFEMAPIKCLFQLNEGHLTWLHFPKEASSRQQLRAFLFLVDDLKDWETTSLAKV